MASNFETNCIICGERLRFYDDETYLCLGCQCDIFHRPADADEQKIIADAPAEIYDNSDIAACMDTAAEYAPEHADQDLEGDERAVFDGITDKQWDALTKLYREIIWRTDEADAMCDDVQRAYEHAISRAYLAGYRAAKEEEQDG